MTHPAILTYGQTVQKEFPLIMIIGREPNNSTMSDSSFGEYKFEDFPNCAFWNQSFGLLATYNSKKTFEVKQMFQRAKSSPIIFTDASPKGIPNKEVNKKQFRSLLTKDEFKHQVDTIFSNEKLISRVKLILLSGLTDISFLYFTTELTTRAMQHSIPTKEIPFLFGNNFPKIKNIITDKEIQILQSVFNEFYQG